MNSISHSQPSEQVALLHPRKMPAIHQYLCRHNIAARHWLKMADLLKISKDGSIIANFGEEVEETL